VGRDLTSGIQYSAFAPVEICGVCYPILHMQKHHPTLSSYHFKRAKTDGLIEVLNEGSYVMAEYSERTGIVKWQRVVLAAQKEKIEKWLGDHYPAHA